MLQFVIVILKVDRYDADQIWDHIYVRSSMDGVMNECNHIYLHIHNG